MSKHPDLPPDLSELADALRALAAAPAPEPDPRFVDGLERALVGDALAPVRRLAPRHPGDRRLAARRRLLPVGGATIAVSAIFVVGAAAAGVAATRAIVSSPSHPDRDRPPATDTAPPSTDEPSGSAVKAVPSTAAPATDVEVTDPTSTVQPPPVTSAAPTTEPAPTTPTTSPPATTTPPPPTSTTAPAPATTAVATTVPATTPSTAVPASTEAPTTTEVRTPASMTLSCRPEPAGVGCTWSAGPDGTVGYVVLRGDPAGGPGRVLTPPAGATSFLDTSAVAGSTYLYLVHASDASGTFVAHTNLVTVTCCG